MDDVRNLWWIANSCCVRLSDFGRVVGRDSTGVYTANNATRSWRLGLMDIIARRTRERTTLYPANFENRDSITVINDINIIGPIYYTVPYGCLGVIGFAAAAVLYY
jgi:hypothetical protein